MISLWNKNDAKLHQESALELRVYSSRLLGQCSDLVLHGGGNTSVKILESNLFGKEETILYIKGSGHDLASINTSGFAPVRRQQLLDLLSLETLADTELLNQQKLALSSVNAPSPSVETLLHAILPHTYVDHTHADAINAISNSKHGASILQEIYGKDVLLIPYALPGFLLAKEVWRFKNELKEGQYKAMILMNHGVVTFANEAEESYTNMIMLVSQAEDYLKSQNAQQLATAHATPDLLKLASIRKEVSKICKHAVLATLDSSPEACGFASLANVEDLATRGPLTSDHLIRTRAFPAILHEGTEQEILDFTTRYQEYLKCHLDSEQSTLNTAPKWGVWSNNGLLSFGESVEETQIIADITKHTATAIQRAESIGGWAPVNEQHQFEAEYLPSQQAKLTANPASNSEPGLTEDFSGKIALVTGAASGIGLACAEALHAQGAVVAGLDLTPSIKDRWSGLGKLGIVCDVTDSDSLERAVNKTVACFGGLDIVVCNAGSFPAGKSIDAIEHQVWDQSLSLNLTSTQRLLQYCIPYLKLGIDSSIVFIASRNVPAPGPGAAAYSVPKAAQTQLARIAALELGSFGVRVNVLHPDCVYDTGIWTPEALERSAKRYGLTVAEYKSRNVLKTEVSSQEVANLVCAMSSKLFAKITGAQLPLDGGNDRVI